MGEEPEDIVLRHLRALRDGQSEGTKELRELKREMRSELRAIDGNLQGIVRLLNSQQEVDHVHSVRLDALEERLQKLESKNNGAQI